MNQGHGAFFLGAGASRAGGFPMTRDLIYGIAAAIQGSRERFRELSEYLESMFGFGPHEAEVAAELWQTSAGTERSLADGARERGLLLLPDVTDVLSTMDVIIAEEGGLGFAGARDGDRFLDATRLRAVREQIASALFQSFDFVEERLGERPAVIGEFVRQLRPGDVVITSNWDILVDQARDDHFGTSGGDQGTPVGLVAAGALRREGGRPGTLLKLHGSTNWAYCRRCHVLWVNPQLNLGRFVDLGPLRGISAASLKSEGGVCDCQPISRNTETTTRMCGRPPSSRSRGPRSGSSSATRFRPTKCHDLRGRLPGLSRARPRPTRVTASRGNAGYLSSRSRPPCGPCCSAGGLR